MKDLLDSLALTGVLHRRLGDLGRRNAGTSMTASKMKRIAVVDGPVRVFAGGRTIADVEESAIPAKDIVRDPSIIVKSRGNIGFTYYERPFTHKAELWSYTLDDADVDQKFIYYYLLTRLGELQELARSTSVKLPQLSVRDTDNLNVPVPPLEVQREIVRILDNFTELQAELQAELEARRRQYAHCRLQFLHFEESEAEWVPLSEVGTWYGGGTPSKSVAEFWTNGTIPWLSPKDMISDTVTSTQLHVSESATRRGAIKVVPKHCIALVVRSNILRRRMPTAYVPISVTLNQDMRAVVPRDGINPKYLAFVIHANADRILADAGRTDGSMAAIESSKLRDFRVQIPDLPTQDRVVDALDNFDALVNDLSIGLPAEIAARRQQYEHYRDKLLTFEEAS